MKRLETRELFIIFATWALEHGPTLDGEESPVERMERLCRLAIAGHIDGRLLDRYRDWLKGRASSAPLASPR